MWIPYGHENIHTFSFAGTVWPRSDVVRAWGYPYDQWYGVRSGPRSGSVYQAKHDYVIFDPLGPGRLLTGLLGARNRW